MTSFPSGSSPVGEPTGATWSTWGLQVRLVVTDPACLEPARDLLDADLAAIDLACSRFRDDAEIVALDRAAGARTTVSPLLAEAIAVALQAARDTDGVVDPTLGRRLSELGYDRDFAALPGDGPAVRLVVARTADWRDVEFDAQDRTVRMPAGVGLDLGATAKAWAADRCAARLTAQLGCGVLVSLGGDVALAGTPPEGGWRIDVRERQDDLASGTVAVPTGGIATSGTTARRWMRGGEWLHHLIDPATGLPAVSRWRTVTVAATTCLAANIATTATIVRGDDGLEALRATGLPARLVAQDGRVTVLGGWPADS
jgi:thiamine biosynthesis lipoprotein ApbE